MCIRDSLKGEGDTTDKHFDDTIYGGDFLANQTPEMCIRDRLYPLPLRIPQARLFSPRFSSSSA